MHVIEIETMQGMTATDRCDRCGAQAYVEVALEGEGGTLLFCAHDFAKARDALSRTEAMVADHTPYLRKLETEKTIEPAV